MAYQTRAVEFAPEIIPVLIDDVVGPALFQRRNEALYASPAGEVTDSDFEHDAPVLIDYCDAWLTRIHDQEAIAERIGTTAVLK
jgi:hypothetical protein